MRAVGLAILGLALGAVVGFIATLTIVWFWFDVLGMTGDETRTKPGLNWLVTLGPVLMLGSGGTITWWTIRRDQSGKSVWAVAVLGVVALVAIAAFLVPVLG